MATLVTEPLGNTINYTEWARLIQKTTFEAGSFIALGLTNMNTISAPQVARGSRVEVGGSLYKCSDTADETITGTPGTGQNYIYCVPAGASASFTYSTTAPTWNSVKGGWYNGNNRAVAKVYFTGSGGGSQYNGKVILDGYNAIRAVNTEQSVPTSGGVQSVSVPVNQVLSGTLQPGIYRIELKAGKGGTGGTGGAGGSAGGAGAEGESITFTLRLNEARGIVYALGGDGNDGGSGDAHEAGSGYGAGGGCSGGSAFISILDEGKFWKTYGGSGGGGGRGSGGRGGGGGGGGAYGAGENSDGEGGNDGTGGNGKTYNVTFGGGGGSGIIRGGTGYQSGGGLGVKGGDGASSGYGDIAGGASAGPDEPAASALKENIPQIQYQGGGGGGGGSSGGKGGGGLKSTSSGYLRILRMW
jgi:hypothetical protein